MLCRACDGAEQKPERRRRQADQWCDRCGHLLGVEELQRQANQKRSQLAKFGLDWPAPPLLKPNERT